MALMADMLAHAQGGRATYALAMTEKDQTKATALLQSGRIERAGESIYYEWVTSDEADTRPVVVLTHGAGGSHAVWYHQVLALADRYRVLSWDSRGFGNSSCRSATVSVDDAVADLDGILDAVGVSEPVHLVGQSMGGWWVVGFALAHPERVRSLTLSDTPGGVWTDELRQHFASSRVGSVSSQTRVASHPALGATTQRLRPDLAFLYQQLGSFHQPPMAEVLRVLGATNVDVATMTGVGSRVLVLAGEEDTIFPAPMLRRLAEALGAAYREIPAAGHSPYFEAPEAYNELLLAFLDD